MNRRLFTGTRSICLAVLALATFAKYARGQAGAKITVAANVLVNKGHEIPHNEVWLEADRENPGRFVACSIAMTPETGTYQSAVYSSFDDGTNWEQTLITGKDPRYVAYGDNACAYAPGGTALFVTMGRTADPPTPCSVTSCGGYGPMIVYYSTDGGKHWQESAYKAGSGRMHDRPFITADYSPTSPYKGRAYISGLIEIWDFENGDLGGGIGLYRSLDAGRTWERPVVAIPSQKSKFYQIVNLATLSDGTVLVLAHEVAWDPDSGKEAPWLSAPKSPNGNLKVLRSTDGGETFEPAVTITDTFRDWRGQGGGMPGILAADQSNGPFRDRVYVVYKDRRRGRDEIFVSRSTDKGKSWTSPVIVDMDVVTAPGKNARPENTKPSVTVNSTGVVGVMWFDRRNHTDDYSYDTRFSASLDGGESWLPSVTVSSAPDIVGDPRQAVFVYNQEPETRTQKGKAAHFSIKEFDYVTGGDMSGISSGTDGRFHVLWVDNRTGNQDVWTAPVTVEGTVRDPDAELAQWQDVTDQIRVLTDHTGWDAATHQAFFDVRLKNGSDRPLSGPIKLHISSLTSERGIPKVLDASGKPAPCAILDVSALLPDGKLNPKEVSKPMKLTFRIEHLLPELQPGDYPVKFGLVDFDLRAFIPPSQTTPR
jgi:hypothetical protein